MSESLEFRKLNTQARPVLQRLLTWERLIIKHWENCITDKPQPNWEAGGKWDMYYTILGTNFIVRNFICPQAFNNRQIQHHRLQDIQDPHAFLELDHADSFITLGAFIFELTRSPWGVAWLSSPSRFSQPYSEMPNCLLPTACLVCGEDLKGLVSENSSERYCQYCKSSDVKVGINTGLNAFLKLTCSKRPLSIRDIDDLCRIARGLYDHLNNLICNTTYNPRIWLADGYKEHYHPIGSCSYWLEAITYRLKPRLECMPYIKFPDDFIGKNVSLKETGMYEGISLSDLSVVSKPDWSKCNEGFWGEETDPSTLILEAIAQDNLALPSNCNLPRFLETPINYQIKGLKVACGIPPHL